MRPCAYLNLHAPFPENEADIRHPSPRYTFRTHEIRVSHMCLGRKRVLWPGTKHVLLEYFRAFLRPCVKKGCAPGTGPLHNLRNRLHILRVRTKYASLSLGGGRAVSLVRCPCKTQITKGMFETCCLGLGLHLCFSWKTPAPLRRSSLRKLGIFAEFSWSFGLFLVKQHKGHRANKAVFTTSCICIGLERFARGQHGSPKHLQWWCPVSSPSCLYFRDTPALAQSYYSLHPFSI